MIKDENKFNGRIIRGYAIIAKGDEPERIGKETYQIQKFPSFKQMWKVVGELIPKGKAREFNLAVLDFAASLCLPRNPKCPGCSILGICRHNISMWHGNFDNSNRTSVP